MPLASARKKAAGPEKSSRLSRNPGQDTGQEGRAGHAGLLGPLHPHARMECCTVHTSGQGYASLAQMLLQLASPWFPGKAT